MNLVSVRFMKMVYILDVDLMIDLNQFQDGYLYDSVSVWVIVGGRNLPPTMLIVGNSPGSVPFTSARCYHSVHK